MEASTTNRKRKRRGGIDRRGHAVRAHRARARLQERSRRFVEDVLFPLEEEAERLHGRLPQDAIDLVKAEAVDAGLVGGLHKPEHGGQGWSTFEWALVEEQFGRSTNAIHWHIPNAYNVWHHASDAQVERYLLPALRGEIRDAYAVTERDAGSDPSRIASVAQRNGRRLSPERREVVRDDRRRQAAVLVVMANVIDGARLASHPFRRRRGRCRASR